MTPQRRKERIVLNSRMFSLDSWRARSCSWSLKILRKDPKKGEYLGYITILQFVVNFFVSTVKYFNFANRKPDYGSGLIHPKSWIRIEC
jgi:hypothetical protein